MKPKPTMGTAAESKTARIWLHDNRSPVVARRRDNVSRANVEFWSARNDEKAGVFRGLALTGRFSIAREAKRRACGAVLEAMARCMLLAAAAEVVEKKKGESFGFCELELEPTNVAKFSVFLRSFLMGELSLQYHE
jgi:hypothetical protein